MDAQSVQDSVEVALNILEAMAIAVSEPRLNLQRGRWGDAQQYFQWQENEEEQSFE
jgi:hypothetical protein